MRKPSQDGSPQDRVDKQKQNPSLPPASDSLFPQSRPSQEPLAIPKYQQGPCLELSPDGGFETESSNLKLP